MSSATFLPVVLLLIAALALYLLARHLRQRSGLPQGKVIYSDTGAWQRNDHSFYSATYGVSGKPDYLVRERKDIIPVEVKSSVAPSAPHEGHVMQLAAYCLLVEETTGSRPTYGIIQYADRSFRVDYTERLRDRLLETLSQMRQVATQPNGPRRDHQNPRRCATCGVRESCDQRLM